MKVVIFAGGLGTRISEESFFKPKPMIEIGGRPILWHIMKVYEAQGFNDFVICLGYKGYMIKEYFLNYYLYNSDVSINLKSNSFLIHRTEAEDFHITLVDTGLMTCTAGRLKHVEQYLRNETFMLTYGDGLADVNLNDLIDFHRSHGKVATVTAVQPAGRFGLLGMGDEGERVIGFKEKPLGDGGWINGGFFVLQPEIFSYLPPDSDNIMWEDAPIEGLCRDSQLVAYKHNGFWKCMDALRDKAELETLWETGEAKWKLWQ